MKLEDEIDLLHAELDELQARFDSLWTHFNNSNPFALSEWIKRGEEE